VRQRHDLLAQAAGVARSRGVGAAARGIARPPGRGRPGRLVEGVLGLGERARPRGGKKTGPNPTDRGKRGSKRHLVVDRRGVPLAVIHTAANVHDSKALEEVIDTIAPIRRPRGRGRGSARRSCTPTRATTFPAAGRRSGRGASRAASPGAA
jgi:hypothetical protein